MTVLAADNLNPVVVINQADSVFDNLAKKEKKEGRTT